MLNEDVNDLVIEKGNDQNKISLSELDSDLSENELCQTRIVDSISSKLNTILQGPSSSSDVESRFDGHYSPCRITLSTLQHRSNIDANDVPTLERIALELNSIALDWRSYRALTHCTCSVPFDSVQRKVC